MTAEMAITATYYLPLNPPEMERYVTTVVRPVLDVIPMFVILVLLFVIGIRKQKGLWSTPVPQQQQYPVGEGGLPPQQQLPMVWQGQQHVQPQGQFQTQPYYAYPQYPVQNGSQPGMAPPAQQPMMAQQQKTVA